MLVGLVWLLQRLLCRAKIATPSLAQVAGLVTTAYAQSVTTNLSWLILQQETIHYENLQIKL